MTDDNDYRRGRHCVFAIHVPLVFVTKYRRRVFCKEVLDDMRGVLAGVCADFDAQLVEMDGEDDHVHLLVNYPPKIPLTKPVNSLKGVSSRRLRQMHPALRRRCWKGVLWSPSLSILRHPAAVRPAASLANTSNGKEPLTRIHLCADAPCAYLRAEPRSLRR